MEVTAPDLTVALNLLIAAGTFSGLVFAGLSFFRKWQRKDMEEVVEAKITPLKEKAETALNMAEKHEGVLFGSSDPKDGLIAQVNYLQGQADARRELMQERAHEPA